MTSIKSPKSNIYISKKCVLTEREIEYLSLASFGFKNKEIAKILSVTVGNNCIYSQYDKCGYFELYRR